MVILLKTNLHNITEGAFGIHKKKKITEGPESYYDDDDLPGRGVTNK